MLAPHAGAAMSVVTSGCQYGEMPCPVLFLAPRSLFVRECARAYRVREGSRNCVTHNCECDYVMKPRKGSKKKSVQESRPQMADGRSDSDSTMASTGSSDDGLPSGKLVGKGQVVGPVVGPVVVAPSYYVLPPTQARLLHHMSTIAQSIEAGRSSDLVIYLKKLPM